MKCKICGEETELFDTALVLNKHEVKYYSCPDCGFIQTEEPYWLEEAYSDAITENDIGLLGRNYFFSESISAIIKVMYREANSFLDYGGGYGVFVRLMRDRGFDFEWYDKYCDNLFAKGYEKKRDSYDIVTAFELFEHFEDPIEEIKKLSDLGRTIIFSTKVIPAERPQINDWWYYGPEHGQHLSFYSERSLEKLAGMIGKKYIGNGSIHVFSDKDRSERKLHFCIDHRKLVNRIIKRASLTDSDYKALQNGESQKTD